jgi:hypothetical protein
MDLARNIVVKVVEENKLKTFKMRYVFNVAIRGFLAKITQEEAAILVNDPIPPCITGGARRICPH